MKYIVSLLILLFVVASCGTSQQSRMNTIVDNESVVAVSFNQLSKYDQKELARKALMDYCENNMSESLMDYYKAYNVEFMYSDAKREFGAFEDINFLPLDSGNYEIAASITTINSDKKYNIDPNMGRINIVGVGVELNKNGEVISRKYYVSFIKNEKETFYYFDESGLPTRSLFTSHNRQ